MMACDSRESVVLRTQRGARALPLLRVVTSRLASRQNLLMEQIDDVQLALETLLAEEPEGEGELVLEIWPGERSVTLRLDGYDESPIAQSIGPPEGTADSPFRGLYD